MRRHTLLIDADDTLWENNVFFERVIEDFISLVEPLGYARDYTRRILNETSGATFASTATACAALGDRSRKPI